MLDNLDYIQKEELESVWKFLREKTLIKPFHFVGKVWRWVKKCVVKISTTAGLKKLEEHIPRSIEGKNGFRNWWTRNMPYKTPYLGWIIIISGGGSRRAPYVRTRIRCARVVVNSRNKLKQWGLKLKCTVII